MAIGKQGNQVIARTTRGNKGDMRVHCLFEQSGTFKNEFKKLGYEAFDYDILNDYGETDYIIDLFAEIRGGYENKPSIFDNITPDDLILAFFPCTRFEAQISMLFRGEGKQQKNHTDKEKLLYNLKLHKELSENYEAISKMAIIALDRGFRMMIENPANLPHYLTSYWCIKPKIVDTDRRENGDRQKKPTQYFFIGFEPMHNLVFEPITWVEQRTHGYIKNEDGKSAKTLRSEIHPQYANRFIRQYLIDEKEKKA